MPNQPEFNRQSWWYETHMREGGKPARTNQPAEQDCQAIARNTWPWHVFPLESSWSWEIRDNPPLPDLSTGRFWVFCFYFDIFSMHSFFLAGWFIELVHTVSDKPKQISPFSVSLSWWTCWPSDCLFRFFGSTSSTNRATSIEGLATKYKTHSIILYHKIIFSQILRETELHTRRKRLLGLPHEDNRMFGIPPQCCADMEISTEKEWKVATPSNLLVRSNFNSRNCCSHHVRSRGHFHDF